MSSTHISNNATLWKTSHFSGISSINGSTHRITLPLKHEPTGSVPRAMLCASLPPALLSPPTGSLRPRALHGSGARLTHRPEALRWGSCCTAGSGCPNRISLQETPRRTSTGARQQDTKLEESSGGNLSAYWVQTRTYWAPSVLLHTKSTNLDKTPMFKWHAWHT